MGKRTWIVVGGIVALGTALGVAWDFQRATCSSERALRALTAERARLEAQARRWEQETALATNRTTVIKSTKAVVPAGKSEPTNTMEKILIRQERLRNDPEVQVRHLAVRRAELAVSYGPLAHRLKLSAAQRDELTRIFGEFEMNEIDLRAIRSVSGGDKESAATLAIAREKAATDLREKQLILLGPEGFQQLQDYERTRPGRDVVGGFAGRAAVCGLPVTPKQADELTQAMADASGRYRAGGKMDANQTDWKSVEQKAATILSPEQMRLWAQTDVNPGWAAAYNAALKTAYDQDAAGKRK